MEALSWSSWAKVGEAEAFFFSFGTRGCCSLDAVDEVLGRHFVVPPPPPPPAGGVCGARVFVSVLCLYALYTLYVFCLVSCGCFCSL